MVIHGHWSILHGCWLLNNQSTTTIILSHWLISHGQHRMVSMAWKPPRCLRPSHHVAMQWLNTYHGGCTPIPGVWACTHPSRGKPTTSSRNCSRAAGLGMLHQFDAGLDQSLGRRDASGLDFFNDSGGWMCVLWFVLIKDVCACVCVFKD